MADQESTSPADNPPAAAPSKARMAALFHFLRQRRRLILISAGVLLLLFVIVPWALHAFRTVSTDDAYINSYVTFVAPRVSGQVARVLVDDNNRVRKGDVLVELDPEPYRVQLAIKQAGVDTARASFAVAEASTRSQIAHTRGLRFNLQHAIEDVDNQIAIVRARVATWESAKATQVLAQAEFDRAKKLLETRVSSKEEY